MSTDIELRTCNECGETKPLVAGFYANPNGRGGYMARCRMCVGAANARRYRAKRATSEGDALIRRQRRLVHVRLKYGLTPEEYDELMQPGVCSACGGAEDLTIDHNHENGHPRGVLCGDCNLAAGKAGDSADRLRAIADYLDEQNARVAALPPRQIHVPKPGGRKQTHCKRNHLLEGENVRIRPNGTRICRLCARIRDAERYAAKRAAAQQAKQWPRP